MTTLRTLIGVLLVLSGAAIGAIGTAGAQEEYTVSPGSNINTIEVPERDITGPDEGEFRITTIGQLDYEEELFPTVTYSIPESNDENLELTVFNSKAEEADALDESTEGLDRGVGNDETLTLTDADPGTYAVVMQNGERYAAQPLVISGYQISNINVEESQTEAVVSMDVSEISGADPESIAGVSVVVDDSSDTGETFNAANTGGNTYEATIDYSDLPSGERESYITVLSDDTVAFLEDEIADGNNEPVAIQSIGAIAVPDEESGEDSDPDDGTSGTTGGSGGAVGGAEGPADLSPTGTGEPAVSDSSVKVGEPVEVSAEFRNTGGEAVLETVDLLANGDSVAETELVVTSGGTDTISFTHSFEQPGEYSLAIDGNTLERQSVGTVTVSSETSGSSSEGTSETDSNGSTDGSASGESTGGTESSTPGFGLVTVILALLSTAALASRQQ